jgi:tetratricopeptide (TPR) repeat protein
MADIFAIQDEITAAIVDSLKVTLNLGERAVLRKRSTNDPEAYSLYLKGLYFFARTSPESLERALNCYQAAIDKDPSFAQAYAGMAQIFVALAMYSFAPPAEVLPKAKAALQKALSMDENLAEAHAAAAMLALYFDWDWEAAGRSFDRALSLNPGDAMAHAQHGWLLVIMRRSDEAVQEIKKAQELDPLMPLYYAWSVGIHMTISRPDEALKEFSKALEIDPTNGLAYFHAAWSYSLKGLLDEALETLEESKRLFVFPGWTETVFARIYHLKGDREQVERILEELIERKKTVKQTSAYSITCTAALLGKTDLAFEYLDKAYEERDSLMPYSHIFTERFSPSMTADPRFKSLLARMKLDL